MVRRSKPAKKPYKRILRYRVCRETPAVLGSGSDYDRDAIVFSEEEAFALLKDGRNRMERTVVDPTGDVAIHYWDDIRKKWFDGSTELPM